MTAPVKYGLIALLIVAGAWTGLHFYGAHESAKAKANNAAATVQSVAGDQSAALGAQDVAHSNVQRVQVGKDDATIKTDSSPLVTDDQTVAADRVKYARKRSTAVRVPRDTQAPPACDVAGPDTPPPEVEADRLIADLTKEVADQKIVIADQAQAIATRDALIASLTAGVNHYQIAYEDERKADALRKIALEAQESATRASRLKGDLEGGGAVAILAVAAHVLFHF